MQRTLITEQPDGTFQCTVTLTADELPEFLRTVPRLGLPVGAVRECGSIVAEIEKAAEPAPAVAEKPPAQRAAVKGIDVSAVQKAGALLPPDVTVMLGHSRFLTFAEQHFGPVPDDVDVRDHIAQRVAVNGPHQWESFLCEYQRWHLDTFPGQNPFPVG